MNADYDPHTPRLEPDEADAEAQLEASRARLKQRLAEANSPSPLMAAWGESAAPAARRVVREHPYTALAGATIAGVVLTRWLPWRGLGGSLLASWAVRQLVSRSLVSGSQALGSKMLGRMLRPAQAKSGTG